MLYVIISNIKGALNLNIMSIIGIVACSIVMYGLWGVVSKDKEDKSK